ncbi:MAG: RNA-binding domain-containing protein [Bacteroidota bacterium]
MALPVNIDDLINSKTVESVRVEFKTGWNPFDVLRTVCAFANDIDEYGGGYVIIGIAENNGSPILPPQGLEQKVIDSIQRDFFQLCQNNIKENIFPAIEEIDFQGKKIIVIWITTGEQRPYYASSSLAKNSKMVIYVRHGTVTKEATLDQERQLRELASFKHFDDRVNSKAILEDIDLGLILSYLQEIKSQLYNEASTLSFEQLCLKMQIARGPKENIKPLNVGLLLFCKEPEKYFPGGITNLVEFENEAGTKYSEKSFKGPIHIQIRHILDYINTNIIKEYVRKDPHKVESDRFFNYPYAALEEVIVNALYHRSYENSTPNEIRVYKTGEQRRIEVLSYPGPLPPIDDHALQGLKITARNYRNIKLGDWLKNLRLAEKYATGIPTIVDVLYSNGSPKPLLSTDEAKSHFLVIIKIHEDTPIESSKHVEETERIILSEQQQIILERLTIEPISEEEFNSIYAGINQKEIDFLISKDLLGVKNVGDSKLYFISQKGVIVLKRSF